MLFFSTTLASILGVLGSGATGDNCIDATPILIFVLF